MFKSFTFLKLVLILMSSCAWAELTPTVDRLKLSEKFKAEVFAEGVGPARHIVSRANGAVYVHLAKATKRGAIVALRDTDGDHKADQIKYFETIAGTGLEIFEDYLYFSSDTAVYRRKFNGDEFVPTGKRELIVGGFPVQKEHAPKAFAISPTGDLYVNVGAPSNSCQVKDRIRGSMGINPCPLLEDHAGIWRFSARTPGQQFKDGERYASGLRNIVAMAWNAEVGKLYVVQQGRDSLHDLFPDLYTEKQSAELPAEEFIALSEGYVGAWPYAYWDHFRKQFVIAPEYNGDGQRTTDQYPAPLYAFPAHYAPNDLIFYKGGALVAFHGSWNRLGFSQEGFQVSYLPMKNGMPSGTDEIFMNGFEGPKNIKNPEEAMYRPMGLAETPDGNLLVVDSEKGRIWFVQSAP
jgi:glucose/arabinose dehydrogenase